MQLLRFNVLKLLIHRLCFNADSYKVMNTKFFKRKFCGCFILLLNYKFITLFFFSHSKWPLWEDWIKIYNITFDSNLNNNFILRLKFTTKFVHILIFMQQKLCAMGRFGWNVKVNEMKCKIIYQISSIKHE